MSSNITTGGPTFVNFENSPQPMNFDSVPLHQLSQTEYVSGPVMYNQPNTGSIQSTHRPTLLPAPISSPQHESATSTVDHVQTYNSSHGIPSTHQSPIQNFEFSNKSKDTISQNYRERGFTDSYNGYHTSQEERLKTPEPPVISDTKVILLYTITKSYFFIVIYISFCIIKTTNIILKLISSIFTYLLT